jgi:hypothetical protein
VPKNLPVTPYTHAAVMGDLVASEGAPSSAKLHAIFNQAVIETNRREAARLSSPLTITLGDEFQGLCRTLSDGVLLVQGLRLLLLGEQVECRFAVGAVRIQTPVNRERAWNMMGPGLADTREKLTDKRNPNAYRFFLPETKTAEALLEAVGYSLTLTETRWTVRQQEVVRASLDSSVTDAALAGQLGLSVRNLYKVRSAAQFEFYRDQWETLNLAMAELDQQYGLPHG